MRSSRFARWLHDYWMLLTTAGTLIATGVAYINTQNEAQNQRITRIETEIRDQRSANSAIALRMDYVILGFCDPAQRTSVELRSLLECQRRSLRYGLPVDSTRTR